MTDMCPYAAAAAAAYILSYKLQQQQDGTSSNKLVIPILRHGVLLESADYMHVRKYI